MPFSRDERSNKSQIQKSRVRVWQKTVRTWRISSLILRGWLKKADFQSFKWPSGFFERLPEMIFNKNRCSALWMQWWDKRGINSSASSTSASLIAPCGPAGLNRHRHFSHLASAQMFGFQVSDKSIKMHAAAARGSDSSSSSSAAVGVTGGGGLGD